MRLATLRNGRPDGELVVVSRTATRFLSARDIAPSLREALEDWRSTEPALRDIADRLDAVPDHGTPIEQAVFDAPLPRAWQWLDASAFPSHGALMQKAFSLPPIETDRPLMYQGMSHRFLSASDPVQFPSEADGIDFEAELGVIVDDVPMGVTPDEAAGHIRLAVLLNDWSLRAIAPIEMKTGFGWMGAKPACSMAPIAVTLDALGPAWRDDCRFDVTVEVLMNDTRFGNVRSTEMEFGFDELIAHAARTRNLCAGTIIGSGTVSSVESRMVGSCCIAERRAVEMIDQGAPRTDFLHFGDSVTVTARTDEGTEPWGRLDQRVALAAADPIQGNAV